MSKITIIDFSRLIMIVLDDLERVKQPNKYIYTFHQYKLIFIDDNFKEVSLLYNNESLSYGKLIISAHLPSSQR